MGGTGRMGRKGAAWSRMCPMEIHAPDQPITGWKQAQMKPAR
jgi:hypothetical protein